MRSSADRETESEVSETGKQPADTAGSEAGLLIDRLVMRLKKQCYCFAIQVEKHLSEFMVRFGKQFPRYLIRVGAHVSTLTSLLVLYLLLYLKKCWNLALSLTASPRKWVRFGLNRAAEFVSRPFRKAADAWKGLAAAAKSSCRKHGVCSAAGTCVTMIGKGAWRKRSLLVTAFNYAAPVACIAFLFNVVSYGTSRTYAVSVELGGEVLGYIAQESDYEEAEQIMQQRIVYVAGNDTVQTDPTFKVEQVTDAKLMDKTELADLLITHADQDIEQAYGVYVDGEFMGAVADKAALEDTLNDQLGKYKEEFPDAEVSFMKDIEFQSGMYLSDSLVDASGLVDLFNSKKDVDVYYTTLEGDTPTGIAQKNQIDYSELKALNPGIEQKLLIGQQVLLSKAQPYLSVEIKRVETYDQAMEYETEQTEDSSKYKGVVTVLQDGKEGTASVTDEVTYVDGYETQRDEISRTITLEPVSKIISVGTKAPLPSQQVSTASTNGGMFIWPAGGGYVSAGWGDGRGHKGVDIAAPAGTPIYAGASGTVVLSQTYSDYGKCVIIDHGNGVQTLYGHASALYVTAGQKVTQGDMIAAVGRTGQATGNHVHFEVRINGVKVNPKNYVSWY